MHPISLLAAGSTGININPANGTGLPGNGTLSDLASGLGHWALLAAIVGVIVGGVMWAFGHNFHKLLLTCPVVVFSGGMV